MKFFLLLLFVSSLFAEKPELFLLNRYSEDMNVTSWYMSEKLDGVRAYWDGEKLTSRSGKVFCDTEVFTKDFPKMELDVELWSKRGDFSNISSIVNQKLPHAKWSELTYNIFEVPHANGGLLQRLKNIQNSKYIRGIEQIKVEDKNHLDAFLKNVEKEGGDGVVVRDGSLDYYTGRDDNALKVKSYRDEECEVVGYNKGEGKYEGMTGSLSYRRENKQVINIGSDLSDEQRVHPPK